MRPRRSLLTGTPDETLGTHDSFHRLVQKCARDERSALEDRNAAVNLSDTADIDPGGVLLMMYTGLQLLRRSWSLYVTGDGAALRKVSKNLQHLRLTAKNRPLYERDAGDYPLRQVSDRNSMVAELEDWADTLREDADVRAEDVAAWSMQIGEVVANTFQHSQPGRGVPSVLLCGGVRRDTVQLAALDIGQGIPACVRPALPPKLQEARDSVLIREACRLGVTSRSTRWNQGYGLPHLIDLVKKNGGTLQFFSQRGLVHLKGQKLYKRNLEKSERRLDGTLTIISLVLG